MHLSIAQQTTSFICFFCCLAASARIFCLGVAFQYSTIIFLHLDDADMGQAVMKNLIVINIPLFAGF